MIDYNIKSRMSQIKSHQKIGQNSYAGKFRKIKVDDAMFFSQEGPRTNQHKRSTKTTWG